MHICRDGIYPLQIIRLELDLEIFRNEMCLRLAHDTTRIISFLRESEAICSFDCRIYY